MGRNRKNGSATWLVPGAKAALICVLLGGSAIGYVYQKNQLVELGRQIQRSEQQLRGLQAGNARLQGLMLTLQSPTYLEQQVRERKLPLAQPVQSQILTIVETTVGTAPAPKSQPLFAENQLARTRRQ